MKKKDYKVFYVTAPFETSNSGDYDYVRSIVNAQNQQAPRSAAYLLTNSNLDLSSVNVLNEVRNNNERFQSALVDAQNNSNRKEVVKRIKDYILTSARKNNQIPILNLQLRPPETGALFMPSDLQDFKEAGIKICIICHEYKLNHTRRHLQAYSQKFFAVADKVIFFNRKDAANACAHALQTNFINVNSIMTTSPNESQFTDRGHIKILQKDKKYEFNHQAYNLREKVILSAVPPTVGSNFGSIKSNLERPANAITFGLIRKDKGFDIALDIARNIKEVNPESRMKFIIAGKPVDPLLIADIINEKFDLTADSNNPDYIRDSEIKSLLKQENGISRLNQKIKTLEAKYEEKSPIDIHLDLSPEQLKELFKQAKYAIKYDGKGWANNASGHINALANGCILYASWGFATDDDVLPARTKIPRSTNPQPTEIEAGKYNGAIVFLSENKYSLKPGLHLTAKEELNEGKRLHYRISSNKKQYTNKSLITAQKVLVDIQAREEEENQESNRHTLLQSKRLLDEKFNVATISKQMINEFDLLVKQSKISKNITMNQLEKSNGPDSPSLHEPTQNQLPSLNNKKLSNDEPLQRIREKLKLMSKNIPRYALPTKSSLSQAEYGILKNTDINNRPRAKLQPWR